MKKLFNRKHGFTLIELMIVMAIIAILAVLGFAAFSAARKTARNTQRQDIARRIQMGLEEWYIAYKSYPRRDSDTGGANAEWGWSGCGHGVPIHTLFNAYLSAPPWVREANWDGHGSLSQFISEPLMDPMGYDLRTTPESDCVTYPGKAYARESFRYKWVSSSSYGIRVRNELTAPNCQDAGVHFAEEILQNRCATPAIEDPLDALKPELGSFLFSIE